MISLSQPSPQYDDQHLAGICSVSAWSPFFPSWLAAYAGYRNYRGNPWHINKTTFFPDVSEAQGSLYDAQSQTVRIKAIRDTNLLSCPMCGSPVTGTLDHYLPRKEFPEFSVMAANLVPACIHCNSGKKRRIFRGMNADERFLHPYFDSTARLPIWFVQVLPPYRAATFEPCVMPSLSGSLAKTVAFHLKNVLGKQFYRSVENKWSTLPRLVRNDVGVGGKVSSLDVARVIRDKLRDAHVALGQNSWDAAFFRGLVNDSSAQSHLLGAVPS